MAGILRLAAAAALVCALTELSLGAGNPFSLSVTLTLSPKAAALLKQKKESVTVGALYQGDPVPAKTDLADFKGGTISLGEEYVTVPGASGRVAITGAKVLKDRLGWVKEPRVAVMAFSSRKVVPTNLINCTILESAVAAAHKAPLAIACKLIGE